MVSDRDLVFNGVSVCCVGLWKKKAAAVAAPEKREKQEHFKWYLLGAARTKFLTMSGRWADVSVMLHAREEGITIPSPQRGIMLPPSNCSSDPKGLSCKFLRVQGQHEAGWISANAGAEWLVCCVYTVAERFQNE